MFCLSSVVCLNFFSGLVWIFKASYFFLCSYTFQETSLVISLSWLILTIIQSRTNIIKLKLGMAYIG